MKTGKCLDRFSAQEGAKVIVKTCTGGPERQWFVPPNAPTGGVKLINRSDYLCVEITGSSSADGAGLETSDCSLWARVGSCAPAWPTTALRPRQLKTHCSRSISQCWRHSTPADMNTMVPGGWIR
ncbi:RICIN domain-containing protein [Longispora sp. K20-0274]|uniref:RICIN domain-containing protein n=1 Tax=Longispora sp. K20-0274 TaxID=3088255 RepID=UPI00399A13D6